jgi:hypothetical protein
MFYEIENSTALASVSLQKWNDSLDMKLRDRHSVMADWRLQGSIVIDRADARALAIALLNMSGNASALIKKLRWED